MNSDDSVIRANEYGRARGILIDFDNPLGIGQEGMVWKTNRETAIKVFDRIENFSREVACYTILRERDIYDVAGFTVRKLIEEDHELRVVEMSIVSAPYLLDFGKSWVGRRPDYSSEQWEEYEEGRKELFGANWDLVGSAMSVLKRYGFCYIDASPNNINCHNHPLAAKLD